MQKNSWISNFDKHFVVLSPHKTLRCIFSPLENRLNLVLIPWQQIAKLNISLLTNFANLEEIFTNSFHDTAFCHSCKMESGFRILWPGWQHWEFRRNRIHWPTIWQIALWVVSNEKNPAVIHLTPSPRSRFIVHAVSFNHFLFMIAFREELVSTKYAF